MSVLFLLIGIAIVVAGFWIAVGRLDASLADQESDLRPDVRDGEPTFDVVFRGYRMDEVDATIADLQAQVEQLRGNSRGRTS